MVMKEVDPHEEGMSMCVCGCVRILHSKLSLKLEEELSSQMNTLAHFYSQ